ncbi:MAG: hypothetical protein ACOC1T_01560 [Halorhodospira sp.]
MDEVADELAEKAAERGGNALVNVRWTNFDDGSTTAEPICTTGWGWFALGGVGGLHPWVRGAEASGMAVYAEETQLEAMGERVSELRAEEEAQRGTGEEAERGDKGDVEGDADADS